MRNVQFKNCLTMEGFDFYRDNVALLYRHFDDFRTSARYFFTPVPFEVKYELFLKKSKKPFQVLRLVKDPITIGALFLCWEQQPDLFRVSERGKEGFIIAINGSPLTGTEHWLAVDPDNGDVFSGMGGERFRTRCGALNTAVLQSEEALEKIRVGKGLNGFSPATMEELVEYVKGLEND